MKLKFGKGNSKIADNVATFSIPAGKTCPGAESCKSTAIMGKDGKVSVKDFPSTVFRCFAASDEARYPNVYKARKFNLEALKSVLKKSVKDAADLIQKSLPKSLIIRVHVSGDFFSQDYFDAWMEVAKREPLRHFYAYTKSIPFWVARKNSIPSNFSLTASMGGKNDKDAIFNGLRTAQVVYSETEASSIGIEIDHDDSKAMSKNGDDFALLIHGPQPAKSEASKALSLLPIKGYSKTRRGKALAVVV